MAFCATLTFLATHPITRPHRARALLRYLAWQVRSRIWPRDHVHSWIAGTRFVVRKGETGLTGNLYAGLHEYEHMAFLLHVLRPGDLFVDVGANAGSYTLLACGAVGARGYAFEPVPSAFARLQANLALNGLHASVAARRKALGSEAGTMAFTSTHDTGNHALAAAEAGAGNAIPVEVQTMDVELGGDVPAMIKIDVEGLEFAVLAGAKRTLADERLRCIILELNGSGSRYGVSDDELVAKMKQHGFRCFRYLPQEKALVRLDGKDEAAGNTLFIRDESWVRSRLLDAPSWRVLGVSV